MTRKNGNVDAAPVRYFQFLYSSRLNTALWLLVLSAASLPFIARIQIVCNDDAFVYFTYAKNFVAGRLFAYDIRNIPSEGFTSLLFLLLLLPFEALKCNMPFGATLLALAGLFASGAAAATIFSNDNPRHAKYVVPFFALVTLLFLSDRTIVQTCSWGFDTTLSFIFPLMSISLISRRFTGDSDDNGRRWMPVFVILLFLSAVSRPENSVYLSVLIVLFFIKLPGRNSRYRYAAVILTIVSAGIFCKLMLFSDLFPTGFYRKIGSAGLFPGLFFVKQFIEHYAVHLLLLVVLFATRQFMASSRNPLLFNKVSGARLVLLFGIMNLLIVAQITPLVGIGFRFLFVAQCAIYYLLVENIFHIAVSIVRIVKYSWQPVSIGVPLLALVGACCKLTISPIPSVGEAYAQALKKTNEHHYFKFGRHLQEHIPHHKEITLVFGDAGAIPHEFDGTFIDVNGLTEPPIARLFRVRDPSVRAHKFTDYVLNQHPDIIVLAFGALHSDTSFQTLNNHSPFYDVNPLSIYKTYNSYGFEYLVSLPMYYDLHIGIDPHSPFRNEIVSALLSYAAANNGYRCKDGIVIKGDSGSVRFRCFTGEQKSLPQQSASKRRTP